MRDYGAEGRTKVGAGSEKPQFLPVNGLFYQERHAIFIQISQTLGNMVAW
jgi:hypothetical protein